LEVQGECIMRLSTLAKYNRTAKEPLKNARNAAAGALRNLDPSVTASRHLDAFFYQIGTIENPPYDSQPGMLDFLRQNGFQVSPYLGSSKGREDLENCIRDIEKRRGELDWLSCVATALAINSSIAFIPTPGNAGAAEGSFYLVFSRLTSGSVFWAMLFWRFFNYYAWILLGGISFSAMFLGKKPEQKEKMKEEIQEQMEENL
ncbi:MAG: flippase-like domain-containing protein, partial [Clostridia bacterium]|nr:flippase-like domain-containing protein [Clostridia bacterium]